MTPNEAKFRLLNRNPFFGTILFQLPIEEDSTKCATAGVDGFKLFYNAKWWDGLSNKTQLGVLAHEVGHLFLGHLWRMGSRQDICIDPQTGQTVALWNIAADIAVNNIILKDNFEVPKGGCVEKKYDGKSTEEIYELLKKKIPQMSKKDLQDLIDKMYNDKTKWGKGSKKSQKEQASKWKNIGKQAMEYAKQQGKLPQGLDRLFEELEPKEDWRQILLSYVLPFSNDYSFNPVDRRFLDCDFALPDIQAGEKIDWIAVGIDTSGSIGQKELNHFISEIKAILSCYDKVKVRLTFCDAEATPFVELEEFDASKIKVVGGGGTDFKPVFNLIKKEQNDPVALLYFTDLCGDFPSKEPNYDVVWVATEKQKVPFGKVLPYEI